MDFDLTDDQRMLADTVRDFATKSSPVGRFRKLRDADGIGWERHVWKQMGELGWLSVPFPESVGGFGGSFVEVALVLEQFGAELVPEPYLPSVVLGGMALSLAGDGTQQGRWLAPMIAGETTLGLAWAERQGRYDVGAIETRAEPEGAGYVLHGEKVWVLGGHAADHLVVSARAPAGPSLFVLDPSAAGADVRTVRTMDGHRAGWLRLEGARVGKEARLGEEGGALPVLERVMDFGAAAAVAEGVGICRRALDMTVEYLQTRQQFGVKIGSFQALQHRAVDMFVEAELLRSVSFEAMVRASSEDGAERRSAVSAAKLQLTSGGRYVLQQAVQLHGGIGVTDEADVGLYFKRLHVLSSLFGDAAHHVERFASQPGFFG